MDLTLEVGGCQLPAKTLDLSPYGVKIGLPPESVTVPVGTRLQLRFTLDDERRPVSLEARICRIDPGGIALSFAKLGALVFARLKELADSLLQGPSGGSKRLGLWVTAVKDRRQSRRADAELETRIKDPEQPHGWRGTTVDLSLSGVKVAFPDMPFRPSWGAGVEVRLAAADGQPPLVLKGIVWRREPQSLAVLFVELGREEITRLKSLVDSLGGRGFE